MGGTSVQVRNQSLRADLRNFEGDSFKNNLNIDGYGLLMCIQIHSILVLLGGSSIFLSRLLRRGRLLEFMLTLLRISRTVVTLRPAGRFIFSSFRFITFSLGRWVEFIVGIKILL